MANYAYIRVSTNIQVEEGHSIENQKARVNHFLTNEYPDERFNRIFVEESVSGSIKFKERPIGSHLCDIAKEGDKIVVAKLDRMFRNFTDAGITMSYMKELKCQLFILDLGPDDVLHGPVAKLMFCILAAFSDFERGRIRERIIEVKDYLKRKNLHSGGHVPYCFAVVQHEEITEGHKKVIKKLVVDKKKVRSLEYMKKIRDKLNNGRPMPYRTIATKVNKKFVFYKDDGITPHPIQFQQIQKMISNYEEFHPFLGDSALPSSTPCINEEVNLNPETLTKEIQIAVYEADAENGDKNAVKKLAELRSSISPNDSLSIRKNE